MTTQLNNSVVEQLLSYSYSYPHKSSYRRFEPAVPLRQVWQEEDQSHLALYLHIPFCEMRCGFCNLFTKSQPQNDLVTRYLATLHRQMDVVRATVPDANFSSFVMGGGTPTYLSAAELRLLLTKTEYTFEFRIAAIESGIETSPATATPDRLEVLEEFGFDRISIGIQSFLEEGTRALGRPQSRAAAERALELIRRRNFPCLNIDLIYGGGTQTEAEWRASLKTALAYRPEELYLYPLYVRPQTGLSRMGISTLHEDRFYQIGRDCLLEGGYLQLSMRCFRRIDASRGISEYACQQDGMIGLGCGARSYTRTLHYGTRFATTQAGVAAILQNWILQSDNELALATHGISLDDEEQRRRFLILGILQKSGLDLTEYRHLFDSEPFDDFSELDRLTETKWVVNTGNRLILTEDGVANSDLVGPMLYSERVRHALREFISP